METTFKPTQKLKNIIGGYNKRKVFVTVYKDTEPHSHNTSTYWDGGNISRYTLLNLETEKITIPESGKYPDFQVNTFIKPGFVLISHGTFLGKPATAHIRFYEVDRNKVQGILFDNL